MVSFRFFSDQFILFFLYHPNPKFGFEMMFGLERAFKNWVLYKFNDSFPR